MPTEEFGTLSVRTYTASEALPIAGALVEISGAEESNRDLFYSVITDRDGKTENLSLPTPNRSLSLSPGALDVPYSVYDMQISAPGYYTKNVYGLTVFPGVTSLQLVNMIPLSKNNVRENAPRDNLDTIIPPNENL